MKKGVKDIFLAALLLGMGGGANVSDLRPEDIDTSPKKTPIPKGCKEYFFFENRLYTHQANDQCVFSCIANSEKRAYKKFDKWKNNNPDKEVS